MQFLAFCGIKFWKLIPKCWSLTSTRAPNTEFTPLDSKQRYQLDDSTRAANLKTIDTLLQIYFKIKTITNQDLKITAIFQGGGYLGSLT